jgi:hypothetical protein
MTTTDYTRALFGANAVHVPAWLYVQDQGPGLVSFVGSSRVDGGPHPMRFGSQRIHQLVIGELVVRPHAVTGTDALEGHGIASLITGTYHDEALAGDRIIGLPELFR